MVFRKDQIEASLQEEKKLIEDGTLKEDNPLDDSKIFIRLCEACRRGDLKTCQEMIIEGANINARDVRFSRYHNNPSESDPVSRHVFATFDFLDNLQGSISALIKAILTPKPYSSALIIRP